MQEQSLDDKYVVVKRKDWDEAKAAQAALQLIYSHIAPVLPEPISGGFFVVRDQDIFGPQVLYGYAHVIQSFLEAFETTGILPEGFDVAALEELADRCIATAEEWRMNPQTVRKIPD